MINDANDRKVIDSESRKNDWIKDDISQGKAEEVRRSNVKPGPLIDVLRKMALAGNTYTWEELEEMLGDDGYDD